MNKAMNKMKSVHLEITASQTSPKVKETISQNSGLAYGTQYVTTGSEHASVILTKTNAYLSGNNSGLSAFFALPPDDLPLVASKWIVIKAGAKQYTTFVNTISISHLLKNLVPSSTPRSVRAITYHSRLAYELAWSVKTSTTTSKLTLVLPRTGQILPIVETVVAGSTTEQSVLTKWNQSFAIKVPKNTIAITKLHSS